MQRFTMAVDRCFEIVSEATVERCGRSVFVGQSEGFGKQTNTGFGCTNDSDWKVIALDHHFRSSAHVRQKFSKFIGGFRFRDANHMLCHGVIITLRSKIFWMSKSAGVASMQSVSCFDLAFPEPEQERTASEHLCPRHLISPKKKFWPSCCARCAIATTVSSLAVKASP